MQPKYLDNTLARISEPVFCLTGQIPTQLGILQGFTGENDVNVMIVAKAITPDHWVPVGVPYLAAFSFKNLLPAGAGILTAKARNGTSIISTAGAKRGPKPRAHRSTTRAGTSAAQA